MVNGTLPDGKHKMKIFYLERGNAESNLTMEMNLATPSYVYGMRNVYSWYEGVAQLEKQDETGNALEGAEFKLKDNTTNTYVQKDGKDLVLKPTLDNTGKAVVTVDGLLEGTYTFEETVFPSGYENSLKNTNLSFEVKADNGNQTIQIIVYNKQKTLDLNLKKVRNGNVPLQDITFDLYKKENGEYTKISDDSNPIISAGDGSFTLTGLTVGDYRLEETNTPAGYQKSTIEFSVKINAAGDLEVTGLPENNTIKNELKPIELNLIKTDDTGKHFLKDAEFAIYSDSEKTKQVATIKTDENGQGILTPVPASGNDIFNKDGQVIMKDADILLYLVETKAPDGYRKLLKDMVLTIKTDGSLAVTGIDESQVEFVKGTGDSLNTINVTVKNEPKAPLPSTGGPGTLLFTLIGVLAVTAAGIYLFLHKDREVA